MRAVDVAVVGAGPGGAAAAVSIRKVAPKLNVRVFERAPDLNRSGSVVGLASNGLAAVEAMGPDVRSTIEGRILPDGPLVGYNSKGQELRWAESLKTTYNSGVIPWFEVQQGLLGFLPPDTLEFGCDLQSLAITNTDGVELQFRDQEPVRAKVVIGCDGNQSKVRRVLLGDGPPTFVRSASWRGITTVPSDWPHLDQTASWFGDSPATGVAYFSVLRGGLMAWQVFANWHPDRLAELGDGRYVGSQPGAGAPQDRVQRCLSVPLLRGDEFPDFPTYVRDVILATDPASITEHGVFYREPEACQVWGRGPVTLLGDAAHLSTPMLGQGLNQALEDAVELGRAIGEHGPTEAALREYERVRVPRATAVQAGSVALAKASMGTPGTGTPRLTELGWHKENPWCMSYRPEPLVPKADVSGTA